MSRPKKLLLNCGLVVLAVVPPILYSYEYGPDPGYTAAPGDNPSGCNALGCHTNTPNSGGGSVKITASGGTTYVPGQMQQIMVTITDSTERRYGFELTARVDSNPKVQGAGTLAPMDAKTQEVDCKTSGVSPFLGSCPSGNTLQWIEHTLAGYTASSAPGYTYTFNWTPPATNVGTVTLYAAGNAGSGALNVALTHTYLTSLQLSPGGSAPSVMGVASASAFGDFSAVAPGSWMEIYGSNLSSGTRSWTGSDFTGNNAPTALDGVKVTIGGQAAYVYYISPGQIDAQVPSNVTPGSAQMTVTAGSATSAAFNVTVNALQPGLLAPPSFALGGKQYVVAQFADQSFVLPPNAIAGVASRQAKPGETIIIYGVGFGPAMASDNATIPAGQIVTQLNQLSNAMTMQIGGMPATLTYQGLAPNYVGLYQFNVVVPAVPDSDAVPLTFTLAGSGGSQTLYTAVHQ